MDCVGLLTSPRVACYRHKVGGYLILVHSEISASAPLSTLEWWRREVVGMLSHNAAQRPKRQGPEYTPQECSSAHHPSPHRGHLLLGVWQRLTHIYTSAAAPQSPRAKVPPKNVMPWKKHITQSILGLWPLWNILAERGVERDCGRGPWLRMGRTVYMSWRL